MKKIKRTLSIMLYIISMIPYIIYIGAITLVYIVVWGTATLLKKLVDLWK